MTEARQHWRASVLRDWRMEETMTKGPFLALVLCLMLGSQVAASGTGTICGSICEDGSGKSIAYAVVQIAGTPMGAQADKNGQFCIWFVPAGRYVLEASICGYFTVRVLEFTVVADSVSFADFVMKPDSLSGPCCILTIGRDDLRVSETSLSKTITSEKIRSFPATSVSELLRKRGAGTFR